MSDPYPNTQRSPRGSRAMNRSRSIFSFASSRVPIELDYMGCSRIAVSPERIPDRMSQTRRPPIVGRYMQEEVALASRNSGMPLEALRYDVTPAGLHYLLVHFDIPEANPDWALSIGGHVAKPR